MSVRYRVYIDTDFVSGSKRAFFVCDVVGSFLLGSEHLCLSTFVDSFLDGLHPKLAVPRRSRLEVDLVATSGIRQHELEGEIICGNVEDEHRVRTIYSHLCYRELP